jgi:hypothetical protein
MKNLNSTRIATGGLAAGFVLIAGEMLMEPFVGSSHELWLQELGLPVPGMEVMALLTIMAFIVGMIMVWLYAILKDHYGKGPRTAVAVGLVVWFLNCLMPNLAIMSFGALSAGLFWYFTAHQLIVVPVAAITGAWLYRDAREVREAATVSATPR